MESSLKRFEKTVDDYNWNKGNTTLCNKNKKPSKMIVEVRIVRWINL